MLKDVIEAKQIYTDNENTLWWDAIMLKMRNLIPTFEVYEGDKRTCWFTKESSAILFSISN